VLRNSAPKNFLKFFNLLSCNHLRIASQGGSIDWQNVMLDSFRMLGKVSRVVGSSGEKW
jgi:hypothetical protein